MGDEHGEPVVDLQLDLGPLGPHLRLHARRQDQLPRRPHSRGQRARRLPRGAGRRPDQPEFTHRSTRDLARAGLRQFLDIGTGIPTPPNLHEIAQGVAPDARVVYTDNDPIVLAHAAALLRSTPQGRTAYLQADVTDPGAIVTAPQVLATLDLSRPVALSLNALMHFVPDGDRNRAHEVVEELKAALPSGSALAMSHATADFSPEAMARISDIYAAAGTTVTYRTKAEFARFFDGWELWQPGITLPHQWRPDDPGDATHVTDAEAACYAAVARKP
ncbi:SAM-dependent methyltransferase OS=Streptomyces rimosus subsp. rimosus (strain ATCC / DSM 40260/ JCM 4667 / NRRL 2234) OX=1265868 GN=SRIM_006030 PE=4 SV=1 [Streptomyces rimosus subsp. rimosus]